VTLEQHRIRPTANPSGSGMVLQRRCACGGTPGPTGECESCRRKREAQGSTLQRKASSTNSVNEVPETVREVLRSPGQQIDLGTREFMNAQFGHDFSHVKVHTDSRAAESARSVNALAYTVGRDIVFGAGQYAPQANAGRELLAHELAHTVQQGGKAYQPGHDLALDEPAALEHQACTTAAAVAVGKPVPTFQAHGAALMRLTPQAFRAQLGATQDQKSAMDALFTDAVFLKLWNYLLNCPATPKRDLGPLALKVTPGLKIGGAERFGGYFGGALEINPTKPEHQSNPAELVDTVVHELIHAVDDLQAACKAAGAGDAPLAGAATMNPLGDRERSASRGTSKADQLERDFGPGASNPCEEFIDINAAAQQIVVQVIRRNITVAGVGKPTVTFVNEILRGDPDAMKAYKVCRDIACAETDRAKRDAAIAACTKTILENFMPARLAPSPKPPKPGISAPQPARPRFGPLYQPRRDFRDKILQSADDLP
jgi:Domain of unknown function (DUF4157)